ncbi:MAG: DNA damage-inducible protein D [Oscillospiraceae bacterium]|nr:DNA damage-inducible protein D [Oscillospiraceae bacterium]
MSNLNASEYVSFEQIKQTKPDGTAFWSARDLANVLEYTQWRNFANVIEKAMLACRNSGFEVAHHFAEVSKMIQMPKGATKAVPDYELTRYACYLIVQNGDPRKKRIALGQTYFAIQTRRQEVADTFNQLDEDNKRLVIRGEVKQWNQMLAEAACRAGLITDLEYATFQNAGYRGLYGGLDVAGIHARKQLKPKEKILDFMGSEELAANLFRITQAESKLEREQVQGADAANLAHHEVGIEVRAAIERVGGTMPENLPTPEKSISQVQREQLELLKKNPGQLMLDE